MTIDEALATLKQLDQFEGVTYTLSVNGGFEPPTPKIKNSQPYNLDLYGKDKDGKIIWHHPLTDSNLQELTDRAIVITELYAKRKPTPNHRKLLL